jgi:hypothetical protein
VTRRRFKNARQRQVAARMRRCWWIESDAWYPPETVLTDREERGGPASLQTFGRSLEGGEPKFNTNARNIRFVDICDVGPTDTYDPLRTLDAASARW